MNGEEPPPYVEVPDDSEGQAFSLVFTRAFGKVIVHIHGGFGADRAQQLRDRLVDVIDGQ